MAGIWCVNGLERGKRFSCHLPGFNEALCHESVNRRDLAEYICFARVHVLLPLSGMGSREASSVEDQPQSIPLYIQARGDEAKAAYQRALETGTTSDKRVKVMLIGQDRVGKTSVGRSLKGEEFRKDESSTEGVQMEGKALGKEEMTGKMADEKELSVDDELHGPQEKKTATKDAAGLESYGNAKREDDIPDKVTRLAIKNLSQKRSDNDDGIWPVIWDFAGQAIFVPFIPSSFQGKQFMFWCLISQKTFLLLPNVV
ncbi:hypothetical protein OS493_036763 [Desmophyllum pertusum]|uniref:Uncharacterized protein n=1 Tax=Desmophyllum pertusum TaxID=174260 RepID=A0A9X0CMZ8_9CNID|nr:hypothetical protein OS493_036763 [Desmophyllum pertusum]